MRRILLLLALGIVIGLGIVFTSRTKRISPETANPPAEIRPAAAPDIEAPSSQGGLIRGKVTYEGVPPSPQKLLVAKDVDVCGKTPLYDESLLVGANKGIQNVVISLVGVKKAPPEPTENQFILNQTGCVYRPHVLLVPVNAPVQILNNDGILHNIHTYGAKNPPVNISQPAMRKKLKMSFTTTERIPVRCDVHGWMLAWVIVVDHRYNAITDANGEFTITDIPPGAYTVNCWQEVLGEQTAQVTVAADSPVALDFKYPAASAVD
jgi:hypothetical protein